jgi:hypothetical protein
VPCPFCSYDLTAFSKEERDEHVALHSLSILPTGTFPFQVIGWNAKNSPLCPSPFVVEDDAPPLDDNDYELPPSLALAFSSSSKTRNRSDVGWSPLTSSLDQLPKNFTIGWSFMPSCCDPYPSCPTQNLNRLTARLPSRSLAVGWVSLGLIQLLHQILLSSPPTRSAILSLPTQTLHIAGLPWLDLTWGCGYRNFQMAYSSLRSHYLSSSSSSLDAGLRESLREEVGIWSLQCWIEEAWAAGWDTIGKKQLGGRLKGVKRWIGAGDIWVGCVYRGIPSVRFSSSESADTGRLIR